jgi:hypothetical protein
VALALLAACTSSPSAPHPSGVASVPPPSPVGKPTGVNVTKTIGSAGGSLSSGDGRVSVTIPAGALASDATVGIQQIENTAAGGLGDAYRLTPAGQTFTQPVQVSFPYVDADLAGSAPEALGIAFQDGRGLWEWQQAVALDTTAKRLTVMTTHFSDWSSVEGLQLRPESATVKVNGQVTLVATSCVAQGKYSVVFMRFRCAEATDELAPLGVRSATWSVNGSVGGSGATGTVRGNGESAVYTAPAKRPAGTGRSVVAVSVEAQIRGKRTLLVANVTITSGYRVVGSFKQAASELVCSGAISSSVSDTVEFSVTPAAGDSFTVSSIKNSTTKFTQPKVPVVALRATVVKAPEIFTAQDGAVEAAAGQDLITVAVNGTTTLGACSFGGQILGTGQTESNRTGLAFYTNKFVGGKQTNIPEDTGFQHWTWVVTEQ